MVENASSDDFKISRPIAAPPVKRKLTYFDPESEKSRTIQSPPADFDQLLDQVGPSRGIFYYSNSDEDPFIYDQESYEKAWVNKGNDLKIQEKSRNLLGQSQENAMDKGKSKDPRITSLFF